MSARPRQVDMRTSEKRLIHCARNLSTAPGLKIPSPVAQADHADVCRLYEQPVGVDADPRTLWGPNEGSDIHRRTVWEPNLGDT